MAYVSCKYAPPPGIPIDPQMAVCTDENGTEWWLDPANNSDPQFQVFLANGGEVEPYEPPAPEAQPPVLTALAPTNAFVGGDDLTLYCIGENFTEESKIIFNGGEEPTTFVSASQLTTIVEPSSASGAWTVPVTIRTGDQESAPQMFSFIEAASP